MTTTTAIADSVTYRHPVRSFVVCDVTDVHGNGPSTVHLAHCETLRGPRTAQAPGLAYCEFRYRARTDDAAIAAHQARFPQAVVTATVCACAQGLNPEPVVLYGLAAK